MNPRRLLRWAAFNLVFGAGTVALVGRLDLVRVWVWLSVFSAMTLLGLFLVSEEMVSARVKRGHRTADPVALLLIRLTSLAHMVVSLLDVGRFHWSDTVPEWLSAAGAAVTAGALAFAMVAVRANRYFVPQVRIQSERGHQLVDRGPYARIRHPGYAAAALLAFASPLALGSWGGLAAGALAAAAFVYRTVGEDRFLHANLPGYPEYASRVRYRLLPGVW